MISISPVLSEQVLLHPKHRYDRNTTDPCRSCDFYFSSYYFCDRYCDDGVVVRKDPGPGARVFPRVRNET